MGTHVFFSRLCGKTYLEDLALIDAEFRLASSEEYREELADLISCLLFPTKASGPS